MFPFKDNFMMSITGPRGSGKSYLVTHLVETKAFNSRFDYIVFYSPSLDVNNDYYTPKLKKNPRVHYVADVTQESINEAFERMYECKRESLLEERSGMNQDDPLVCPKMLVVMDDIIDSGVIHFGSVVDKMAERGRHVNMSVIICSQRVSAISRSIRINSDYFIFFSPYSISELERFLEDFVSKSLKQELRDVVGNVFDKKHQFILVDNVTSDYRHKIKESNTFDLLKNKLSDVDVEGFRSSQVDKRRQRKSAIKDIQY